MQILEHLVERAETAGSDHLPLFGGRFEGGYYLQQVPEELARLICVLAAHSPFQTCLEIGTASGGTTRFIREFVKIEKTVIIDDGKHVRFPIWTSQNRRHVQGLTEFIGDSHSAEARQFLCTLGTRFDLVAIDGDHSAEGVLADWQLVQPFLADGAIVWFHDTRCVPGVAGLWNEVRGRHTVLLETNALGIGVLRLRR
jgi:hypothetical protein